MLAIAGTIPDENFPLVAGPVVLKEGRITVEGNTIPVLRGTPALLAAAVKTIEALGLPLPFCFLAGDTGIGKGSKKLYEHLLRHISKADFTAIAFHYILPDMDYCNRILFSMEAMPRKPLLIADAGFMYAAKMSGQAPAFDLFTPDAGELAFLADEESPHPFYTRGFILHDGNCVPDLIARAYEHENASRHLLVKGRTDYVATQGGVLATVNEPLVETLEPIGGTGDTVTGIVAALISRGMETGEAAVLAAETNRLAGFHAKPTPATQVSDIIEQIPRALAERMNH